MMLHRFSRLHTVVRNIYSKESTSSVLHARCQLFAVNTARNLTSKKHDTEQSSSETDHSHQYGWNTFAAMALGVGVATAIGVYSKWKSTKIKEPSDTSIATTPTAEDKNPRWLEESQLMAKLPDRVPYLIVGAGTAAFSAARSIRARDPKAKVLLIGEEQFSPYMRPPLSKELWLTPAGSEAAGNLDLPAFLQWNGKPRSVFLERSQFYCDTEELATRENGGISVAKGLRVIGLNPRRQTVVVIPASAPLESTEVPRREISYDRCLLATGGKPRILPQFERVLDTGKVTVFRNLEDYKRLTDITNSLIEAAGKDGSSLPIVVVGGGFLGCELAFALAWRAMQKNSSYKVYQVIRERGVLEQVLPAYLSSWTAERLTETGVNIISATEVTKLENDKVGLKLKLSNGDLITAAHVVVAAGIEPNTDLAEEAGLEVDSSIGGIAVNSELMARHNIWAAGDVSSFYDPRLRARRRVEHHDQAIVSGRLAGENMTGAAKVYSQQAMFWSDLGPSVSFEAVGLVDARLQTYAVFAQPTATKEKSTDGSEMPKDFRRGVVFYLSAPASSQKLGDDSRRLVGMLLWNLPGRLGLTRRILKDQPRLSDLDGGVEKLTEIARIMQINDDDSELKLPAEEEDDKKTSDSDELPNEEQERKN